MKHSDQINEIAEALALAQGAMHGALKDSKNPFFNSKYADLAAVYAACKEQLSVNGISVVQSPESTEDCVVTIVETLLMHKSGQWIRGELRMMPVKNDPQGVGSCITYARRYALAAMVGVAPEDDDGNAASKSEGSQGQHRAYAQHPKNNPSTPSMAQEALKDKSVEMAPKSNRKATPSPDQASEGVQNAPEDVDQAGEMKWENFVIPLGLDKGKKLGQISHADRMSLFNTFKENPRIPEQVYFKQALVLWFKDASSKEGKS